jgi:hypothetical protein
VIEVFGSIMDDKLSHDAAASSVCPCIINAIRTTHDPAVTIFIAPSSEVLTRDTCYDVSLLLSEVVTDCRPANEQASPAAAFVAAVGCKPGLAGLFGTVATDR